MEKIVYEVILFPLNRPKVESVKIIVTGQSYAEVYSYLDGIREYLMSGLPEIR
jgi:hypothetical protein